MHGCLIRRLNVSLVTQVNLVFWGLLQFSPLLMRATNLSTARLHYLSFYKWYAAIKCCIQNKNHCCHCHFHPQCVVVIIIMMVVVFIVISIFIARTHAHARGKVAQWGRGGGSKHKVNNTALRNTSISHGHGFLLLYHRFYHCAEFTECPHLT